jgi:hypothetical protein
MMSTVGARVEMGARYHGGACLGSFVGDKRRRLFEPDFPQSARPSVAASEGTGFLQRGRPVVAHCRDGGRPSWRPVVGVVLPPL